MDGAAHGAAAATRPITARCPAATTRNTRACATAAPLATGAVRMAIAAIPPTTAACPTAAGNERFGGGPASPPALPAEPIIRIPSLNLDVSVRFASASHADCRTHWKRPTRPASARRCIRVRGPRYSSRHGPLPVRSRRAALHRAARRSRERAARIIQPRIDAATLFNELAQVLASDSRGRSARPRAVGKRWRVDYLGAPLVARHALWHGVEP